MVDYAVLCTNILNIMSYLVALNVIEVKSSHIEFDTPDRQIDRIEGLSPDSAYL